MEKRAEAVGREDPERDQGQYVEEVEGEPRGKERRVEIPKDEDRVEAKLRELQRRIKEYRQEKQQAEERKAKKRKLEDHWEMMR